MDVTTNIGFKQRPGWLLVLLALAVAQSYLTVRHFCAASSVAWLTDDRPLLAGRHPLHFYHGMLGAQAWRDFGTTCAYDPAYQAGYPKTPVFDASSRPAELFRLMGGTGPAGYKIGVVLCCLAVPLVLAVVARGLSLSPPAACLSALVGGVLWWQGPSGAYFDHGDLDLLLGGICVLLHSSWLIRFERRPGLDSWLVMTGSAALGWYAQPLFMACFMPQLLLYYLWVASRQSLVWHTAIFASGITAVGANAAWLAEWGRQWWVFLPYGGELPPTTAAVGETFLHAVVALLPHDPTHWGVVVIGLIGFVGMIQHNRAAAVMLSIGAFGSLTIAATARIWPLLSELGLERLAIMFSGCLLFPCAALLTGLAEHFGRGMGRRALGAVWLAVALVGLAWAFELPHAWRCRPGLPIGFTPEQSEILETLRTRTTTDARILWEERTPGEGWTALLARETGRSYLGGLDPAGRIEHMYARLSEGSLAGRPLADWTDDALVRFAERYNIGWVVARSLESKQRFARWPGTITLAHFADGGALVKLPRAGSYFLKGFGRIVQADIERIALADLQPVDGEIVLSLHHQPNWRIAPADVHIERDLDPDDPIPMTRLRLNGPVSTLTLTWDTP